MEYGHGFAPIFEVDKVMGESTIFNANFNFLFNLVQPITLGLNVSQTPQSQQFNHIMTALFGCKPFASGLEYTLDFREAADRITYTASNYVHSPMGNILHRNTTAGHFDVGTFDAVLRPKYVEDMMLITPTDSAKYIKKYPKCADWQNCTGSCV